MHLMCNQSKFGSLSFKPTKSEQINNIEIYQKLIRVVMSVIARDYLDDIPVTMMTIRTRAHQLRALLQRLELMQVLALDNEIRETRLEVTVQQVDTVQATRRMCSELHILRVQGLENMLEGNFDRFLISMLDLIQIFKVRVEILEIAMQGMTYAVVPSIRVCVALTLARHIIGWSENNLQCQL